MKVTGSKLEEAVRFLVENVAGEEKPSAEVLKKAKERGINRKTFSRAKVIVQGRSWKKGDKWYMTVPAESKERFDELLKPGTAEQQKGVGGISTDWVNVSMGNNSANYGAEAPAPSVLRIKIGKYEIEADVGFPMEKLIELLRGMGCEAVC
jgi:hypothetical protein